MYIFTTFALLWNPSNASRSMTGILGLAFLLACIATGSSTDLGRSLSSDIEDTVKGILMKFGNSALVNPALELSNVSINIHTGHTNLGGNINASITGIPDTQIVTNKFSVIGMRHTLKLRIPKLSAVGNYSLQGLVVGVIIIDGGGPMLVELEDLTGTFVISVTTQTTKLPALVLKNVTADLSLGKLHVQLDNILGNLSDAFNDMVNEIAPEIINLYEPVIENAVRDLLFDKLSDLLTGGGPTEDEGSQASDLVGQILSLLPGDGPTEVDESQVSDLVGLILSQLITEALGTSL